jgi:hypothetical protein
MARLVRANSHGTVLVRVARTSLAMTVIRYRTNAPTHYVSIHFDQIAFTLARFSSHQRTS